MTSIRKLALACGAIVTSLLPASSFAHGGEDHSPKKEETPAAAAVQGRRAFGVTESFEVVAIVPPEGTPVRFLISDFETNAPIAGAQLEVEIAGVTHQAREVEPGSYDVSLPDVPAGPQDAILSVAAGEKSDLIPIEQVPFAAEVAVAPGRGWRTAALPVAGVLLLAGGAAFFVLRRSRARQAAAAMVVLVAGPLLARAHGGEDHGAPKSAPIPAQPSGGGVGVQKEAQFLLGIRTRVAEEREVVSRLRTIGRVVPRARAQAQVETPQGGRLLPPAEGGSLPSLGSWVEKGALLAYVQVVDRIPIRAPISGVITELGHGPGETVESAEKILTITDLSTVWVEAWIFQDDVGEVEGASAAEITTQAYPGELFRGRQVGISTEVEAHSRSLVSRIEVPNPGRKLRLGMLVDVSFVLPRHQRAIVLPASAVVERFGKPVVYVHREPEVFEPRTVKTGIERQDEITVLEGLAPGDRVVVEGAYQVLAAQNASGS